MATIIDRRKTDKKKHVVSRNKFIKRAKPELKKALRENMNNRSIKDLDKGGDITIPSKGIQEPTFRQGDSGKKEFVRPGNKSHSRGDKIKKPQGGDGKGQGGPEASDDPTKSLDEFQFALSREEFLDLFFEDLELPALVKTALRDIKDYVWRRAGFTQVGIPANLDITRSYINGLSRNIALRSVIDKKIEQCKKHPHDHLEQEIEALEKKKRAIPFLDDIDIRYRLFLKQPVPTTKAVMFCILDVSGSMGEYEKDLAKRFFFLLYLFLTRKYEKVDVIFVRHTTDAQEVDEEKFFYDQQSGGTIVSSGLDLVAKIIKERYSTADWNVYVSQCSDGDNMPYDNEKCSKIINESLLPLIQYFSYVQIGHEFNETTYMWGQWQNNSGLWAEYDKIAKANKKFQMKKLHGPKDIYPVFRELFKKEGLDS